MLFFRLRLRLSVSRKKRVKIKERKRSNKQLFSLLLGGKGNDKGCRDQSQFSRGGKGKKRGIFLKGKAPVVSRRNFYIFIVLPELEKTKNCASPFVFWFFFIVSKLVPELMQLILKTADFYWRPKTTKAFHSLSTGKKDFFFAKIVAGEENFDTSIARQTKL